MNLTYEEYKNIIGGELTEDDFNKLLPKAKITIGNYTRNFYKFTEFESDHDYRKSQVKAALAFQVDYFKEMGVTSHEGMNKSPQSVSLGRTSITQSSSRVADNNRSIAVISHESVMALQGTGLLNRGVS